MTTTQKKSYPIYFYMIGLLIPVLFFVLLEVGLRFADYGKEIPQWIQVSDDFPDRLMLNHEIAKRYFTNIKSTPAPGLQTFKKEKVPGTYRVFVLGGSSAAGYPFDVLGSFSGELNRRMMMEYPGTPIEIVNLAMSAVNSYTLLDLMRGLPDMQPDLVIIYAGHNEYYGALGVGSTESFGNFPWLVNFLIQSEKMKTVQLLKNALAWFMNLIASSEIKNSSGTLMERMVGEQLIPYDSGLYHAGINQFEYNLEKIFSIASEHKIPIALIKLPSNLKDHKPFISDPTKPFGNAEEFFNKGTSFLANGEKDSAYHHFLKAKEYDLLRFRAPEAINQVIERFGEKYQAPIVAADSLLASFSRDGIIGDELMTDHLHPNIMGYRLIGAETYQIIKKYQLTPKEGYQPIPYPILTQRSHVVFPYTSLDTLLAEYKLNVLKSGWPFVPTDKINKYPLSFVDMTNALQKTAFDIVDNKLSVEEGHFKMAKYYLSQNNIPNFLKEIRWLTEYTPFNDSPFLLAAKELIARQQLELAKPYLQYLETNFPSDFSAKWVAIIMLSENKIDGAGYYFKKSYERNPKDAQLLFNYAGYYIKKKEVKFAVALLEECIIAQPNFPGAVELRSQLLRTIK